MPQLPAYAAFAEQVGASFALTTPAGVFTLTLVSADRHPAPPGYESFTLLFRGPASPSLPQAIYPLQHDALGQNEIFLVPIRQDAQGLYYEAVFNMLSEGGGA